MANPSEPLEPGGCGIFTSGVLSGPKEKASFLMVTGLITVLIGVIYIYNSIYNWWPTTSKNQQGPLPKREVKEPVVLQWCVDFL